MKPLVLCILDGCGIREESSGNAFKNANKPNFDFLMEKYPHSILQASEYYVGLPKGQMGTSEVGHMNLGIGRIAVQPLSQINKSIDKKDFFENKEILKLFNHIKKNNSTLHIMGLLSDGGVHSHINHLLSLIDMCKDNNINNVVYHVFTDGRDTEEKSCLKYISILEDKIKETGIGKIATICGRYYGMDRDNNFDRLKKSYDTICYGMAPTYMTPEDLVNANYNNDITDEFLEPGIINHEVIKDGDGVITFNFRKDRLREMFTCLTNPSFYYDDAMKKDMKVNVYNNLYVLTMFPVVESVIAPSVFEDLDLTNKLVDYLHDNHISQLRIAETEKYPHVTFYFDGGEEIEYDDMKKILIPSSKVATYDLKPEMSVNEITEEYLKNADKFDVTIMNFANGDMVGHTGNYEAAVKAVEYMDVCLGKVYNKVMELGGILVVTADHGNCDIMWYEDHTPCTTHTLSPVPFIVTKEGIELQDGILANVSPTLLELMNLPIPKEMTGISLIRKD